MIELLEFISLFRVVWIAGRLGFGKTALATLIAKMLLEERMVDGVVTNYPTVLPASIFGDDDGTLINKCQVWDEAWQDMDSRTSMTNDRTLGAFLRRWGAYFIAPSVHPVDKRLRAVEIRPDFRNVVTGKTHWTYKINDGSAEPSTGKFAVDLKQIYGYYSTSYIPIGDCGFRDRFLYTYYKETGVHYNAKSAERRQTAEIAALVASAGANA